MVRGESQKGKSLWEGLDVGRGAAEIKAHESEPNWRRGWSAGGGGVVVIFSMLFESPGSGARLQVDHPPTVTLGRHLSSL